MRARISTVLVACVAGGSLLSLPGDVSAQPAALRENADDARGGGTVAYTAAKWGCLGTGIVALASGAVLFGLGVADEATIQDAARDSRGRITGVSQARAAELQVSSEGKRTAGVVTMSLGAALTAAGLALWFFAAEPPMAPAHDDGAAPQDERPYGLRISPSLPAGGSDDGAGLGVALTVAF